MTSASSPQPSLGLRLAGAALCLFLLAFTAFWLAASSGLRQVNAFWFGLVLLLVSVGLVGRAIWRRQPPFGSWLGFALVAAPLALVLGWLAWDEPQFDRLVSLQELAPAPAQAETSHQATLAYTRLPGAAQALRTLPDSRFALHSSPDDRAEDWQRAVAADRGAIAREWALLAAERAWFAQLDSFPAIGDAAQADYGNPLINVTVVRRVVLIGCAEASALALEGKGDEALALLRPLASVLLKLERHGRTELRLLMANRALGQVSRTINFVAAHAPLSPEARAGLAAVLADRDWKSIAHRLAWLNYHSAFVNVIGRPGAAFAAIAEEAGVRNPTLIAAFAWARPFVFLPQATANRLARWSDAMEQILLDPDSGPSEDAALRLTREIIRTDVRNFGGHGLIAIATPNVVKWGHALQATEKARGEALAALKKS